MQNCGAKGERCGGQRHARKLTRYQSWHGGTIHTLHAGYDRGDPKISLTAGCRSLAVSISDLSGMDEVRTALRSFRVRTRRGGSRVSVRATDLAENSSIGRVRLPRC